MILTNDYNLPQPFVDAVTNEYTYKPKRYSVTSILKGTREAILQRRHNDEITQDVADMVWMIFGSAMHRILEDGQETKTQLKENWVSAPMPNGYELSGIFDLYDDATGEVTDYKSGSVWKVVKGDWKDYRMQTLAYCWILRQIGFNANKGKVVMLLKDFSPREAKIKKDYPSKPVYIIGWKFSEYELEGFGRWVARKFEEIERCEQLSDDELPLCTPEERWSKPSVWAVTKKGNKKASKLCESKKEATEYAEKYHQRDGANYEVTYRHGEDQKCLNYCSAKAFCSHYRELMKEGK